MTHVTFSTLIKRDNATGEKLPVSRFTRETSGANGSVYDIDYHPDGSTHYLVNCQAAQSLPDLPSTRELMRVAESVKRQAIALLSMETGTTAHRELWWVIKGIVSAG